MITMINFNMGCFEMLGRTRSRSAACLINFNMGCIEILVFMRASSRTDR